MERDGLVLLLGSGHCPTIKNEVDNLSFLFREGVPLDWNEKSPFSSFSHILSPAEPHPIHTHIQITFKS
jgi:hypothetical protein